MAGKSANAPRGNIAQLTKLLNIGVQQCYNLVNSGVIPASDDGVFDLGACAHGYIKYLQSRGGHERQAFVQERTRESRLKSDLLQLQIEEKAGTLVVAADVEAEWQSIVVATRSELLMLPDKLVHEIKALHGISVDASLIETHIHDALNRLANTAPDIPE